MHTIQKKINVINAFIESGKSPTWMFFDKLPIIPLDLRPYTLYEGGRYASHTINDLYRKVISKSLHATSYYERHAPNIIMHGVFSDLQKSIELLFDNSNCHKPEMTDFMVPCKSLKDIFFDRNGLFLDLLNGCDAKTNDFVIKENKCVSYIGIDENIIIPFNVTSIENSAFLDCEKIRLIHIPASVKFISATAFKNCRNLTIYASKGSYAESYAKEKGIPMILE